MAAIDENAKTRQVKAKEFTEVLESFVLACVQRAVYDADQENYLISGWDCVNRNLHNTRECFIESLIDNEIV